MNIKTFLGNENGELNSNSLQKIEGKFGVIKNSEFVKIAGMIQENTIFFDGDTFLRLLSLQEVLEADEDMNVDFKSLKVIPVFDCGENDYIAFDVSLDVWCKFNIVEEFKYAKRDSIFEYFDDGE